jgi:hypothetical protein
MNAAETARGEAHRGVSWDCTISGHRVGVCWGLPYWHPSHDQAFVMPAESTVSWASAPEFGELLSKGPALVVTSSSGGRTRRQIHHVDTERVE